jgi:hypothetical protein
LPCKTSRDDANSKTRATPAPTFSTSSARSTLREPEAPLGWGLLQKGGALILKRKPIWHDSTDASRLRILQKIASAGRDSYSAIGLRTPGEDAAAVHHEIPIRPRFAMRECPEYRMGHGNLGLHYGTPHA